MTEGHKRRIKVYSKMLDLLEPDKCARCNRPGSGWHHRGGSFEPHHIAGRPGWRLFLFVPLCPECHDWVHAHPGQARDQHWIIQPKSP